MKMTSIRMTTVAISLASLLPILGLMVASGDLKKGTFGQIVVTALFFVLFFYWPSIVLAYVGNRSTNSRALPIILLVSSILSTGLWILIAWSFMARDAVDAQAGLAVMVYFGIQLIIVVLATLSFFLLRKK